MFVFRLCSNSRDSDSTSGNINTTAITTAKATGTVIRRIAKIMRKIEAVCRAEPSNSIDNLCHN